MKKLIVIHNVFPIYIKGFWDQLLHSNNIDVEFYFSQKDFEGIKSVDIMESYKKREYDKFHYVKNFIVNKHLIWQSSIIKTCLFNQYDAVIFLGQTTVVSTWIAAIISRLRGKKVIFRGHGMYGNEKTIKLFLRKLFYKIPSDHLVYSERSKQIMQNHGFLKDKIHVIFNSLDYNHQLKVFKQLQSGIIQKNWNFFKNNNPTLFFLGRLTREKKIDLLIKAVSNLNDQKVKFNLLVIGDGQEYDNLKRLAKKLIEDGLCHFTGKVHDENQLSNYIYFSDLCISPGNIGLTAIHTLTYGTPVATHDNSFNQGPEHEVIEENFNGFFFEEDSVISIENKINIWFSKKFTYDKSKLRKIIDLKYNPNYQVNLIKKII